MPRCHGDALARAVLSSGSCLRRKSTNAVRQVLWSFRWERAHSRPSSRNPSRATLARASSSAHALFSLDAAIPSPATALAVAPSLIVIARVEPPTPARRAIARAQALTASRSNVIAWRTQREDVPLRRSPVQLCRLRPLDGSSSNAKEVYSVVDVSVRLQRAEVTHHRLPHRYAARGGAQRD